MLTVIATPQRKMGGLIARRCVALQLYWRRRQNHPVGLDQCPRSSGARFRTQIGGSKSHEFGVSGNRNGLIAFEPRLKTARRVARSPMDFHFSSYKRVTALAPSRPVGHAVLKFEDLNGD